jgi:hypothetical protein
LGRRRFADRAACEIRSPLEPPSALPGGLSRWLSRRGILESRAAFASGALRGVPRAAAAATHLAVCCADARPRRIDGCVSPRATGLFGSRRVGIALLLRPEALSFSRHLSTLPWRARFASPVEALDERSICALRFGRTSGFMARLEAHGAHGRSGHECRFPIARGGARLHAATLGRHPRSRVDFKADAFVCRCHRAAATRGAAHRPLRGCIARRSGGRASRPSELTHWGVAPP